MNDLVEVVVVVCSALSGGGSLYRIYQNHRVWTRVYAVDAVAAGQRRSRGVSKSFRSSGSTDTNDQSSPTTKPDPAAGDSPSSCPSGPGDVAPSGCVHPYVARWAGCQRCRTEGPLSPNLPDHHVRGQSKHTMAAQTREDAA